LLLVKRYIPAVNPSNEIHRYSPSVLCPALLRPHRIPVNVSVAADALNLTRATEALGFRRVDRRARRLAAVREAGLHAWLRIAVALNAGERIVSRASILR
jgi:hypothetical protein